MRVHYVKHVEHEGLGSIGPWLISRRHETSVTDVYREARFPRVDDFDWLVVMGGPMSVNEGRVYPWLAREQEFVAQAIASNKVVLGICLGAQLIARSLGAKVYRNHEPEIGWFKVDLIDDRAAAAPLSGLPGSIEAFHWHWDTFDLPPGASHLARSDGCENQAFSLGPRVLGLQFHLEVTPGTADALIENSRSRPVAGRYVQTSNEMRSSISRFEKLNDIMATILGNLARSNA